MPPSALLAVVAACGWLCGACLGGGSGGCGGGAGGNLVDFRAAAAFIGGSFEYFCGTPLDKVSAIEQRWQIVTLVSALPELWQNSGFMWIASMEVTSMVAKAIPQAMHA